MVFVVFVGGFIFVVFVGVGKGSEAEPLPCPCRDLDHRHALLEFIQEEVEGLEVGLLDACCLHGMGGV